MLDGEARDGSWSRSTEDAFVQMFREDPRVEGTSLTDVDCRTTLCRLRLIHRDEEVEQQFSGIMGWLPGLAVHGFLVPAPDHTSVVYAARAGHRIAVDRRLLAAGPASAKGEHP